MKVNGLKVLLAIGLVTALAPLGRTQTNMEHIPAITVSGDGEARVDPDMATVRIGIQAQAKTAQEAQSQASATAQKIIDGVLKNGVDRKEIHTGSVSLYPIFSEQRPGQTTPPVITAYRAANTLEVRILDLKRVGNVVDSSVAAGANEIQGIEFGLRDDIAARQAALKDAVKKARAKAEAMAEALGVRLDSLAEAIEGSVQIAPMPMARFAVAGVSQTPVEPGQIGVTASVTLKYRFSVGG